MRRIITLLLALLILVSLVSCGNSNSSNTGTDTNATANSGDNEPSGNDTAADTNANSTGADTESAKLTGKLNIIDLEGRDASILRGVRIIGDSIGTTDDINGKESSLDDVRCVFQLNEWIELYPDTDAEYYLRVWILKHRDDQEYYKTCKFSDLMPEFASYCDLHYPADEENPDEWYWGNFYLNPEECEAGYYDFVFTYEGKAIAVLQTRFYNDGEINGKSGSELEALMHE